MTDRDFDDLLDELPPDEITKSVTPWRRSMNRILWGLVLSTLTPTLWNLNNILPAIGVIVMVLGFRTLRKENRWFRLCYILSILRTLWCLTLMFINSSIFRWEIQRSDISTVFSIVSTLLIIAPYIFLVGGVKSVQTKAGHPVHKSSLILRMGCFLVLLLLTLAGNSLGWFVIIAYILLFRALFKLSKELDETGYVISPAGVRCSDRTLTLGYATILIAVIASGFLFFCRYPMHWQEAEALHSGDARQIRQELESLGAPGEVLADLTEEELLQCAGATAVNTSTGLYEEQGLTMTGVAIRQADGNWKIIHHFIWSEDTTFHGTECISLRLPDSGTGPQYWHTETELTGRVLYDDQNGAVLAAPYHRLDTAPGNATLAAFSMPQNSTRQRGYLTYTVSEMNGGSSQYTTWAYTHQTTWLQFPVQTAAGFIQSSSGSSRWVFQTFPAEMLFSHDSQ